jgi:catechol-2,3-dioxygenase
VRLISAAFHAADPEALTAWYGDTLGAAGLPISFVPGKTEAQHFAVHVADLEAWRERLAVPLIRDDEGADEFDFSHWGGARAIYFEDPEGNIVELIARPNARPELSLAEVGLPVEDVGAAVAALEDELGLPHYDGDRATFSAVGDDDGLLIVVSLGRGWFPPRVPAGKAPIEVTISSPCRGSLDVPGSGHQVTSI